MSIVSVRTVVTLAVLGAAAAALASCKKTDSASDSQGLLGKDSPLGSAVANATGSRTPDPCTLLSANEAEVYVGVLGSPPYRATDDGVADVSGELCMYRGTDGRQITIDRIEGGGSAVTKGELAVNIDVTGASGKKDDAVASRGRSFRASIIRSTTMARRPSRVRRSGSRIRRARATCCRSPLWRLRSAPSMAIRRRAVTRPSASTRSRARRVRARTRSSTCGRAGRRTTTC